MSLKAVLLELCDREKRSKSTCMMWKTVSDLLKIMSYTTLVFFFLDQSLTYIINLLCFQVVAMFFERFPCINPVPHNPDFNNLKREGFGKHRGQRRKFNIFSFPAVFSTLSKREMVILATFNFLSANAFSLVTSRILSLGKGLIITDESLGDFV